MTNCEPINCPIPRVAADRTLQLVGRFRFRRIYYVQLRRSKDMIAISIVCVLLICLFRLDLDEVSSRS